jgi:hypothetical protein
MTTVSPSGIEPWQKADRLGFFVLGSTDDLAPFLHWKNELNAHVSSFGWIFHRAHLLAEPPRDEASAMFYGVNTSVQSSPPNADFLVCHEKELAWLTDAELPKIVVTKDASSPQPTRPDVIGWIEVPTV